jgi:transcription factor C subunit 7
VLQIRPPSALTTAFFKAQAKEVADYFLSLPEDQRPTAIFSSPYCEMQAEYCPYTLPMTSDLPDRCLQTSKPTSIALGLPIYAEHGELRLSLQTRRFSHTRISFFYTGISEWFSPVEPGTGLHPRPSSANTLKTHFPEIDASWSSLWYPTRKGEDLDALHDRIADFLTVFFPEVQRRFSGTHRRILLVSHAATVIALARELVGVRSLSFRAACCSLSMLDRKVGDDAQLAVVGGWTARVLGEGSHLKDGPQRDWGFEDVVIADGKVSAIIYHLVHSSHLTLSP